MATKVQSKASKSSKSSKSSKQGSKANPVETAIQVVAVPAEVKSLILASASSDKARAMAATASEQTLVKLGKCIWQVMGKHGYEVTKASVDPLFIAAYTGHPKCPDEATVKLYAGQQRARALSIAFPGGKDGRDDKQKSQEATQNVNRAIKEGLSVHDVYSMASGNKGFNKKGEVIVIKNSKRGGKNRKTPIDNARNACKAFLSAGKTGKLSIEQLFTVFCDAAVDLELIADSNDLSEFLE